jgi:hypothetical protein
MSPKVFVVVVIIIRGFIGVNTGRSIEDEPITKW